MGPNSNQSKEDFLSVRDLTVEYTSEGDVVHAVSHVSFDLKRGQTIGLVGETGAGKTTIAKTIMRILPDYAAHIRGGEIILEGTDLLKISEEEMMKVRGQRISMIFQDPMTALNPIMRVGDQISEVVRTHQEENGSDPVKKAEEMLEMVGIPKERFREYPHQFSGGMKQRVVIAMALACNPDLLIADEPTTALDVTIQAQVLEMIGELKNKYQTAMIMITHDFGIIAQVCDNVGVVYAGEIVEYGSLEQVFDHPSHPYTVGLFHAIPKLTGDETRLDPIPGMVADPTDLPAGCHFSPRCMRCSDACRQEGNIPYVEVEPGHFVRCCHTDIIPEVQ